MTREIGVMFRREQHPATLIDYARRVEAMGFDQLWVVEDCFYMGGIAQAAVALAATERIRVGIGINPAVARNPAFLAMEYATLASAFPSRLIGGIGHGFGGWMAQIGAKPTSWLRSIEEIATAVQRILRGDEVTVSGNYASLDRVRLFDPPTVVPPVLLGVQGERSLRLAGACADGVVLAEGAGPDYVRWARQHLAHGRADANRSDPATVVVYAHCLVDDADPERARTCMRDIVAESVAMQVSPQFAHTSFGRDLGEVAAEGGANAVRAAMSDALLHQLAITGSDADGVAAIERLGEAGADAVILVPPDEADWDAWLGNPFMPVVVGRKSGGPTA